MSKGKVLLTGAGGFIGSHVADQLVERGYDVRAFFHYNGRYDTGVITPTTLSKVESTFGDLTDENTVSEVVKGCDSVIHIGALISVPYSYEQPRATVNVNVLGTLNILQACLEHQTTRVVTTSSSEVYGSADPTPILETHPMKPQSPYAASKVAADAIAKSYFHSFGLPVVVLRPFNTFGPRQSDRALIPNVIKQSLWRDKIEVGSLHPKRDYVYVTDTARAFIAAMEAPKEANGQVVHCGTSVSWSVQEIIEVIQQLTGNRKIVSSTQSRVRPNQSEVLHLLADFAKAVKILGWSPAVPFRTGLSLTIEWMKENQHRFDVARYAV